MEQRNTRNQRKRDRIKCILWAIVTVLMWACVAVLMVKTFAEESNISGSEYRAQIAKYAPTQATVETNVERVEEQPAEEAAETPSAALYDVPLDEELQLHIIERAEAHGIDPAIIMAMAYRESGFNANAIGDGGDSFGLLQIQPRWHYARMERLGCTDLLDPFQNVTVAVDYLAEQIDRYDGDVAKALVAYNQGHFKETVTDYALSVLDMAEELRGEINVYD